MREFRVLMDILRRCACTRTAIIAEAALGADCVGMLELGRSCGCRGVGVRELTKVSWIDSAAERGVLAEDFWHRVMDGGESVMAEPRPA